MIDDQNPERCEICGEPMKADAFYADTCDACAEEDGMDGPWNE